MRPYIVAVAGLLAVAPNGAAGDGINKAARKSPAQEPTNATADEPSRELFAKGVVVSVDERTKSFDLRTSDGIIRVRNPVSVEFLDRFGATLPGMSLSKCKECVYFTIVLTESTAQGSFKFFFVIEALP